VFPVAPTISGHDQKSGVNGATTRWVDFLVKFAKIGGIVEPLGYQMKHT